jgi:shikimate kinase
MPTIVVDEEEREILKHALEIYLSDLREEIYKTESHETKPPLKREEIILKELLKRVGTSN